VFIVIRAEIRPSQRVNKKPQKVWVAVQTDGTILLSADMIVPYGIISLSVCMADTLINDPSRSFWSEVKRIGYTTAIRVHV